MTRLDPRHLNLSARIPRLLNHLLLSRHGNCPIIFANQIAARIALPALCGRRCLKRRLALRRQRREPALLL